MGNIGSSRRNNHHRHHDQHQHPPPPPAPNRPYPPQASQNHYVVAAATSYPYQYPNPNHQNPNPIPNQYYHQNPGYYHGVPPPIPYDYHRVPGVHYQSRAGPPPCVEHQKTVTIKNDVNLKKETLHLEPDEENPGKFLVAFTFDATAPGSITVMFFAKEGQDSNPVSTKGDVVKPVTTSFEQGLGQKFKQPSGTGIDPSILDEAKLTKEGDAEIFPLIVKVDACSPDHSESEASQTGNCQITMAMFEKKEKGEYYVRVLKQILWVNGMKYVLQEIYGIGNAVNGDVDEDDLGKECVICLSEPRDTTVLPCRHMCMCSGCAKVLQSQTNRCPVCRQPVERLLEIKVNNEPDNQEQSSLPT